MDYFGSHLKINLNAIKENYLALSKFATKAEVASVVKADCYSLGSEKIAPSLYAAGCKKFFVSNIQEGINLRKTAKDITIFVLHGIFPGTEKEFTNYNLTPVLNFKEQVVIWNNHAKSLNKKLDAIINIDTGMCRLGFNERDALIVLSKPENTSNINILYIMSHLSCADSIEHVMNDNQLHKFRQVLNYVPKAKLSFCASAGISLGHEYHFDLVRPGISLYGPSFDNNKLGLKQAITLSSRIIQINKITSTKPVGYGSTYHAKKNDVLATIEIGYADGVLRNYEDCYFYINGHKAKVVGRISMDLIMVDVTQVPQELVFIGAEIEIIGSNNTIEDVAITSKTVVHEVLTNLGRRYKMEYVYSKEVAT